MLGSPPPVQSTPDRPAAPAELSRLRPAVVHFGLVLFAAAIVAKSVQLQLVDHATWTTRAERQQLRELMRLTIESHALGVVKINGPDGTPREVDTRALVRQGLRELGVADSTIRKVLRRKRQWITLREQFLPADLERFAGIRGVTRERVMTRVVNAPRGIRPLMGAMRPDGAPNSGLEAELDLVLRGEAGRRPMVLDGLGGRVASPMLTPVAARPGHTVVLTINQALQEIAESQLITALERTGASGGDVVIMDPRDGAVLAMAGWRNGKPAPAVTALTEAYEPGSVMKPFVISRLLDLRLASPDESIDTENGRAVIAGRVLEDEHKAAAMSVRDVVRQSSNVGTAKLSQRLSYAQHYEAMRDFGFGTPTGLPYPAESRGVLYVPAKWGTMTQTSSAIGYEIMATPMQLAAAYVAFANGGELLQPSLVREIRDVHDQVLYRHERRAVRRVVSEEGAALMRTMLESVVDSGTARAAGMATYDVSGKSGTARRREGGVYAAGRYNSTFAGMFPAQDPQYVLVARLIDSRNGYFGGTVAGGLVNGILQGALATREASLDRVALARYAKPLPTPAPRPLTPAQQLARLKDSLRRDSLKAPPPPRAEPAAIADRIIVDLPAPTRVERPAPRGPLQPVPSVYGLDSRQAARTLYAAGFQVSLAAGRAAGREVRTRPAAGVLVRAGSTVQLETPR